MTMRLLFNRGQNLVVRKRTFVLASLQGEDSPGRLSEALRKVNKNWSCLADINSVPHRPRRGTTAGFATFPFSRKRKSLPCRWRLGNQPAPSQKLPLKVCRAQGVFCQRPCPAFRRAAESLSPSDTHSLFTVSFTIISQLTFGCYVCSLFPLYMPAPPKL